MQIIHILNLFNYTIFSKIRGKSKDEIIYTFFAFSNLRLEVGKLFIGYNVLANYYVRYTLAMPDAVGMLGLDFGKEYEIAKELVT